MQIDSLSKLFVDELRGAYHAEAQVLRLLPKMLKAAAQPQLKDAFEARLKTTRKHIERLDGIFEAYQQSSKVKDCSGMAGLVDEVSGILDHDMPAPIKDAALLSAAQRIEHYEMAAYGTLRSFAQVLGDMVSADLLQETLEEAGVADRELSRIAEWKVNLRAREMPSSGLGLVGYLGAEDDRL
jgi:ferritin-like metal-binding protein YciE